MSIWSARSPPSPNPARPSLLRAISSCRAARAPTRRSPPRARADRSASSGPWGAMRSAMARRHPPREGIDVSALARLDEPTGCAFISVASDGENAITVASGANRAVTARTARGVLGCRFRGAGPSDGTAVRRDRRRRRGRARGRRACPPQPCARAAGRRSRPAEGAAAVHRSPDRQRARARRGRRHSGPRAGRTGGDRPRRRCGHGAFDAGDARRRRCAPRLARGFGRDLRGTAHRAGRYDGAGDTLCGVLATGLDAGLDIGEAIRRAVAAASLACLSFGARSAMPSAVRIDQFLAEAR